MDFNFFPSQTMNENRKGPSTFYEKQLLWKQSREKMLESERIRKSQEEEEKGIEEFKSSPKIINLSRKISKPQKNSRMQTIIADLNRVNEILKT